MKPLARRLLALSMALALGACSVGPNYRRPAFDVTPEFKEAQGWKPTEPQDALARGPWWEVFHDDVLNGLEAQINLSNQNVKAAEAAFEQSRALVEQAQSAFWPTVTANAGRERTVSGRSAAVTGISSSGGTISTATGSSGKPVTINTLGIAGNWQIDIWGQVRRQVQSNEATAQSNVALIADAQLSAQAQLATDYFELRAQDQLQIILTDIVAAERAALKITENRYHSGVAALADVVTARTQLLSSEAQQVNTPLQRQILEHAIAVLIGQQPASFSLPATPIRRDVPTVPSGVPSALLERRPDVASAERKIAAANAQIGVAEAAFFPALTLTGSDDYAGNSISELIRTANRVWAIGPSVALSVFDGGLRRAQVAQARAVYDEAIDTYRQTVLTAIQQVEDELVSLRVLEQGTEIQDETVAAARQAETLTLNQYKAGTVPYSSVITAQTTRLSAEETALNTLSQRLQASVALIEALGGGWNATQLPR